jgi:ribulose-phosphate 3-epimerase
MIKIAPSILSADLLQLQKQIQILEKGGADYIHVDVMDGQYVPNITFGPMIVSTLKRITALPLDVHLMVREPDPHIESFAQAGASIITVHPDATTHIHRTLTHIHDHGCQAGISLNPGADISLLRPLYDLLDLVLIMTVNPGFPAQMLIPSTLDKVRQVAEIKRNNNHTFIIEVDGGINGHTIPPVIKAGADMLVIGAAILGQSNVANALQNIRQIVAEAVHDIDSVQ